MKIKTNSFTKLALKRIPRPEKESVHIDVASISFVDKWHRRTFLKAEAPSLSWIEWTLHGKHQDTGKQNNTLHPAATSKDDDDDDDDDDSLATTGMHSAVSGTGCK